MYIIVTYYIKILENYKGQIVPIFEISIFLYARLYLNCMLQSNKEFHNTTILTYKGFFFCNI